MISSVLIEAALRSVFLALAVWIGLRVFGVRNVLAQKVAWGLVLASALAMPVVLPMTEHWSVLPANVRVTIPADPENLLEELQARIQAKTTPEVKPSVVAAPGAAIETTKMEEPGQPLGAEELGNQSVNSAAEVEASDDIAAGYVTPQPAPRRAAAQVQATPPMHDRWPLSTMALFVYLAVAGVLIVRIACGFVAALRLRRAAKPVACDLPTSLAAALDVRCSSKVGSPVTVCSSIVLPPDYASWNGEKLRIVLAHEGSHIRQKDFYLQLLAGVYAAAVWFSPLGWWLKRKLSDLAEAISDRAGLEEAADRASYAQVLLEFAAAPRPTLIGVAMARHGSLSRRIERLLNDVSFRQAFAGTRRALLTVIVVPVALFAATALVRVQAAGQQAPAPPSAPTAPAAEAPAVPVVPVTPEAGVSVPEQISDEEPPAPAVAPQAPEKVVTPKAAENCAPGSVIAPPAPAAPEAVPAPRAVPGVAPVPAPHAPAVMILQGQPGIASLAISPRIMLKTPVIVLPRLAYTPGHATLALIAPPARAGSGAGRGYGIGQSTSSESGTVIASNNGKKSEYRYSYSSNGNSYAIVKGDGSGQMSFNGNIHSSELDKARKQASGKDFLWFERGGKAYIVDDPATLAQIEAMYKPMEDLGRQQDELGKKQEALGKQQEELDKQQETASVPTPDMSKEIAQIEAAMAKLKASQGKNMTQDEFGELQEKLSELQTRLGEIQGQIGEKQGEFGTRMGELGERMGELGSQMGELGERQGKIAEEADQKVKSIIDESLKRGKAKPVQ